jgi:hypothetical protein
VGGYLATAPPVLLGATQAAKYSWQATQHLLDAPPPVALLATDHLWTQAELLAGNTGQWADNWGEPPDLVTSQRVTAQQTKLAMLARQWVAGAARQQAAAGNPAGARPATASDAAAVLQALESSTSTRPKGQSDTPPTRHQRRAGPVTAQTTDQGAARVVAATNAVIQGSLSPAADQAVGLGSSASRLLQCRLDRGHHCAGVVWRAVRRTGDGLAQRLQGGVLHLR